MNAIAIRPTDEIAVAVSQGLPGEQYNAITGAPYRGKNQAFLLMAKAERGYASDAWLTFKQALAIGRVVNKGEKGIGILKVVENKDDNRKGVRGYTVFNIAQTKDLWDGKTVPNDHVNGDCTPHVSCAWPWRSTRSSWREAAIYAHRCRPRRHPPAHPGRP